MFRVSAVIGMRGMLEGNVLCDVAGAVIALAGLLILCGGSDD